MSLYIAAMTAATRDGDPSSALVTRSSWRRLCKLAPMLILRLAKTLVGKMAAWIVRDVDQHHLHVSQGANHGLDSGNVVA